MYNVGIKKSTFYLHISLRQGCGVGAEQQKEGRVKDFSNLSFASLCLRVACHKLVSHFMVLRNKAAQKWGGI